ncbi:MAG: DUF6804 family protein [Bacteroidota bacterium]
MKLQHIKLFLAVILILCVIPFPYSYFLFVRYACTFGFAVLAFQAYASKTPKVVLYLLLSFMFQPFYKVHFDRPFWLVIDLFVAAWLIYEVYFKNRLSDKR